MVWIAVAANKIFYIHIYTTLTLGTVTHIKNALIMLGPRYVSEKCAALHFDDASRAGLNGINSIPWAIKIADLSICAHPKHRALQMYTMLKCC